MTHSTTQRQKLEAKESAILTAAHAEFAEQGFDGARMASIAKRASVAEGTVYLYYRNKAELLEAVVARFWTDLTMGARNAVADIDSVAQQLDALARYHLVQVKGDFDFVGLTSQVRQHQQGDESLNPIRNYVRVFDDIFDRGVQRGEISETAVRWQWRDLFYGQLEYSARTLILRDSDNVEGVLAHLHDVIVNALLANPRATLRQTHSPSHHEEPADKTADALAAIESRLAAIEQQLEGPR